MMEYPTRDAVPLTPWHLNSALEHGKLNGASSHGDVSHRLHQPWRSLSPPCTDNTYHVWMKSEFPEVLNWRFDRTRPFDRPWRIWAANSCAEPAKVPLADDSRMEAIVESDASTFVTAGVSRHQGIPTLKQLARSKPRETLDHQLDHLNLLFVTPAFFSYLAPSALYSHERPYLSRLPHSPTMKRSNICVKHFRVSVNDVSGNEDLFKLDQSGFEFIKFPVQIQSWDDAAVPEYLSKLSAWLKHHLDCSEIFTYAYNFRGMPDSVGRRASKKPFLRAHCGMTPFFVPDATATSCLNRLNLYYPDEAESLMKRRVRFLNIWQPLTVPVQDCPLAFCDFRTVSAEDLIPADIVFPHYCDEAYEVTYSPYHRWFYKRGMEKDDAVIFKLGDNSRVAASRKFCSSAMEVLKGVSNKQCS